MEVKYLKVGALAAQVLELPEPLDHLDWMAAKPGLAQFRWVPPNCRGPLPEALLGLAAADREGDREPHRSRVAVSSGTGGPHPFELGCRLVQRYEGAVELGGVPSRQLGGPPGPLASDQDRGVGPLYWPWQDWVRLYRVVLTLKVEGLSFTGGKGIP